MSFTWLLYVEIWCISLLPWVFSCLDNWDSLGLTDPPTVVPSLAWADPWEVRASPSPSIVVRAFSLGCVLGRCTLPQWWTQLWFCNPLGSFLPICRLSKCLKLEIPMRNCVLRTWDPFRSIRSQKLPYCRWYLGFVLGWPRVSVDTELLVLTNGAPSEINKNLPTVLLCFVWAFFPFFF